MPWCKSTRLASRHDWVHLLARRCPGDHSHQRLLGRQLAAAARYSDSWCRSYARLATTEGQAQAMLRGVRIGEASHPGPPRPRPVLDLDLSVTPATLVRYRNALEQYDRWAVLRSLPCSSSLASCPTEDCNRAVSAFLQWLNQQRSPVYIGSYFLAGLQERHPLLRGRLGPSWRAQRTWVLSAPTRVRAPVDDTVLRAMVVVALLWHWPVTAFLLLLGHRGYMRPGELTALRAGHVRLTDPHFRTGAAVIAAVVRPKTRSSAAPVQAVVVRDQVLLRMAAVTLTGLPPHARLCPDGARGLRLRFDALVAALGAQAGGYTPGGLRGGGAVSDYTSGRSSLTDIMFHGRWASVRSVTHYLQLGAAAVATTRLPPGTGDLCRQLADLLPALSGAGGPLQLSGTEGAPLSRSGTALPP